MIDTLCFGGGGIKGISYLGSLEYLVTEEYLDMDKINTFVGTSSGSIFSFFLNLGFNTKELIDFVRKFDFNKFSLDINCDIFLSKFGIDSGTKILTAVQTFLKEKLDVDDINFIDLYNSTNKELKIVTTNYSLGTNEIFSYKTTPKVSVLLAIRMSISVPIVFTPVEFKGNYYVDGGLTCNFGMKYCNRDTTLGFAVTNLEKKNNLSSLPEYIFNLCSIVMNFNTIGYVEHLESINLKHSYIKIVCRQKEMFKFDVTKNMIDDLLEDGLISTKKYYSNFVVNDIMNNLVEEVEKRNSTK